MVRAYLSFAALAAFGIAAACGSKSGLISSSAPVDASAGSAGTSNGGFGGSGGNGGTSGVGGSAGAGGSGGVVVACNALEAGIASEVLSFPDRHAIAPSAVLLDAFSPPRVALQAFASGGSSTLHDDIRVGRWLVDDAAAAGISLELDPILVGIESHGWANLAVAGGGLRQLAVTWHGDPGGFGRPMFRTLDFDSWTPSPPVDLANVGGGEAVLAFVSGASTGAHGAGYAGDGYGVVWREPQGPNSNATRPVVAVLEPGGAVMLHPHEVSPPTDYPGRTPSLVWSGSTYLLATAVRSCTPGTGPCVDNSIVIARLRPASGDLVDDSGVELATAIPVSPGFVSGRPMLARDGEIVRVAWMELLEDPTAVGAQVRLTTLTAIGLSTGEPIEVLPSQSPLSRVVLLADQGVTALAWAEEGDASLPDSALGRSRIVVRRREPDGSWLSAEIASPLFHDYGAPSLLVRGAPDSLLAVWSARSLSNGYDVTYAARLDCL